MKRIFSILFAVVLVVSFSLIPAALVGASPGPGLVGEWHFDEGTGITASDSSGNANHGTLKPLNSEPTWVSGKLGQALSFDGTNDYVSVPDSASLEPSAITVEAWIKRSSSPGSNKYIVSKHYNMDRNSYALRAYSSGLQFYIGTTSRWYPSPMSGPVWDGNWHHVMGTFDGSYVRLYVDGSEVGMGTPVPVGTSIAYDGAGVNIGGPGDPWLGGPYHFGGKIDEVRIWDTAHPPLHVDDDGNQYATPYTTIQAAVDAAIPGDTIIVHEGTYGPFTVDGKTDLTIQSSSVVTVQGVQSVTTAYTARDCVVFVKDSTDIVLDGLNIQGQGLGPTKNYGVIYENSSGEINDCTISPNTVGDMASVAIGIWDGSEVTVDTCTIENFGRVGMLIYKTCTVQVLGSTIEGQVYSGEGQVCYGIEVEGAYNDATSATASQVTIRGNEIYNCDNTFYEAPTWQSGGVYINGWLEYFPEADSTVIVENNDIHDNYSGIIVIKSLLSYAHYNSIYDNRAFGVESLPAYDTTTTDFDALYNWWGDCSGPGTVGPGTGDNVSANVSYTPWLGMNLSDLRDAIDALVSANFTKTKAWSDQKQALLDKVDAVCGQYGDGAYRGAMKKLERDITRAIERWIVDPPRSTLIAYVNDEIDILEGFLP